MAKLLTFEEFESNWWAEQEINTLPTNSVAFAMFSNGQMDELPHQAYEDYLKERLKECV